MQMQVTHTTCCVVGGGPAGMMLGLLMARAGVDVVVVERRADFLGECLGDTVHPGALGVIDELGLLEDFLALPHEKAPAMSAEIGGETVTLADFSRLPGPCQYMAMMPERSLLEFLADRARQSELFRLQMKSEVTGLVEDADRVVGVTVQTERGVQQIRARVVIAADGRNSTLRSAAGLEVEDVGSAVEVVWFNLPRHEGDIVPARSRFDLGSRMILIDRGAYWRCGVALPSGGLESRRQNGLEAFRSEVAALQPFLAERVNEIRSWDDLTPSSVGMHRLRRWWRSGLLCIGDAAHAMSPIGDFGVILAIQDAVATANILAPHLRTCMADDDDLAAVQRRREWPVRLTQHLQMMLQNRLMHPDPSRFPKFSAALRGAMALPLVARIPARVIGMGFRREHVRVA